MTYEQGQSPLTTEDAVIELIRLRELDVLERARIENELRQEIRALWLRVGQLRSAMPWYRRIFS